MGHRGVARQRDLVDLARSTPPSSHTSPVSWSSACVGERAEPVQRVRVHHRGADPGDHVGAVGLLRVEHRRHRDGGAGGQVEQGGHDGRRAEVEGDAEPALGRVARLDVDEHVVHDHRGHLKCPPASRATGRAARAGRPQVEVVERVAQPLEVGALVGQCRLGQLHAALLQRGPQDHLAPDADRGRLRPGDQRRHDHPQVLGGLGAAGQPPARAQFVGRERARVQPRHRHLALDHLHLALAAGAVAAAGGVDGDAVPAGGVEQRGAGGHPDLAGLGPVGVEVDADPIRGRLAGVGHVQAVFSAAAFSAAARGRGRGGDPGHAPLVVAEQEVGGLDGLDDLRGPARP